MIPALHALLTRDGPLPLARVMHLASSHYYATREPFGASGDFVTAPEISQMFGEVIGLALADCWLRAGRPASLHLLELGPGRGTLLADALRAIGKAVPPFADALTLHLIEQSPRLGARQQAAFPAAQLHPDESTLPTDAPLLVIGNEFLDALPVTQFEKLADGWALRRVTADGRFDLGMAANPAFIPPALRDAATGSVHERGFAAEQWVASLAGRIARQGGAALFIDYGYEGPALGDTLQALRGGRPADPLTTLGEADLSAHVDFSAMAAVARRQTTVAGPLAQGQFLSNLGLNERADALKRHATLAQQAETEAARIRLLAPAAMGTLFKAFTFHAAGWPAMAGFTTDRI